MSKIKAELEIDHQHGPVVRVTIKGVTVSVYLMNETGVITMPDNRQAGIEVTGPWYEFRKIDFSGRTDEPAEIDDEEVKELVRELETAALALPARSHTEINGEYYPFNVCTDAAALIRRLHTQTREDREVITRLVSAMDGARDDLLLRGEVGRKGERVVNMSASRWDEFCDALDDARALSDDREGE